VSVRSLRRLRGTQRRAAVLGGRLLAVEGQRLAKEDDVRVTSAFNRLLRLPGAAVIDVSFGPEGVIVTVRLRRRRRVCSSCGQLGGHIHGRRVRRWRHLDLGASRCIIECELRRLLWLSRGLQVFCISASAPVSTSAHDSRTPGSRAARIAASALVRFAGS
jgi:transposase